MRHLDQHSALPPESITGHDNMPHFGLIISWWMMWLLLVAAGCGDDCDYDVVLGSKMDREPFIEIQCICAF